MPVKSKIRKHVQNYETPPATLQARERVVNIIIVFAVTTGASESLTSKTDHTGTTGRTCERLEIFNGSTCTYRCEISKMLSMRLTNFPAFF